MRGIEMAKTTIRFTSFPRTEPPPQFIPAIVDVFRKHEEDIAMKMLKKGLTSDQVLHELHEDLITLGFAVESGKKMDDKIERPVFYGENGVPSLRYQIDAYHVEWRCGLEIEAGRGWMGNAVYRDIVQAMVMVQVEHICLAVANCYKHRSGNKEVYSTDYDHTVA